MESNPLYLDPAQPLEARVQDLLSRLTLEEKISQMTSEAAAIPRLGIPAYNFWSEGLHGVARNGRATVFPQAIGMAATWDPGLIRRIGAAIGDEARAKHHEALRQKGSTDIYQGLTLWSPNINIFRDPRWGRGQETWGEDPCLTGEMGSAFVQGLQGDHPRYLKVAACAKHFAVHSGPEKLRHVFDARPSRQDLYATYLPAFKKLVMQAKVEAVMGAYNRLYGEPCCASPFLLEQTLRQEWGFEGHVVSDCWALTNIHQDHRVTRNAVETAALALKAGCDISCMCTYDQLGAAVQRGLIREADIDRALARTLKTRFKLGMFDPSEQVPYASTPMSMVGCPEHRDLAFEAALKSMVLLKNQGGLLPINKSLRSLLVVGPNATDLMALLGNYYGLNGSLTTLLEGIAGRIPEGTRIEYRSGSLMAHESANPVNWSIADAAQADLTIACMGITPLLEGEEGESLLTSELGDRADIALPAVQVNYLRELAASGARIVLVLSGGSPLALGPVAEMVSAILWVGYPGQEGGRALASLLFGDAVPSGRLPVTFPQSLDQLPPFDDYAMAGRTYRYFKGEPLYPFGFGLTYTRFAYSNLALEKTVIQSGESLLVHFTLTNVGEVAAEEVVQFYISDLAASTTVPLYRLVGFQRQALQPGEHCEVSFTITPEMLELVDEQGDPRLELGEFRLTIGGCSPGKRGPALGATDPISVVFKVVE